MRIFKVEDVRVGVIGGVDGDDELIVGCRGDWRDVWERCVVVYDGIYVVVEG